MVVQSAIGNGNVYMYSRCKDFNQIMYIHECTQAYMYNVVMYVYMYM